VIILRIRLKRRDLKKYEYIMFTVEFVLAQPSYKPYTYIFIYI